MGKFFFKIVMVFVIDNLFTFVYFWLCRPRAICLQSPNWVQMKALTLSFNLNGVPNCSEHKHGLQGKKKGEKNLSIFEQFSFFSMRPMKMKIYLLK